MSPSAHYTYYRQRKMRKRQNYEGIINRSVRNYQAPEVKPTYHLL